MLAAYELNSKHDTILLQQSTLLANKLLNAWQSLSSSINISGKGQTQTIPYGELNFTTNEPIIQISNIAEAGTLTLEFGLLSSLTGNSVYREKAEDAVKTIIGLAGSNVSWI
jgi:mannosyl-oligosaccharide alpha-1,2-mannosidase